MAGLGNKCLVTWVGGDGSNLSGAVQLTPSLPVSLCVSVQSQQPKTGEEPDVGRFHGNGAHNPMGVVVVFFCITLLWSRYSTAPNSTNAVLFVISLISRLRSIKYYYILHFINMFPHKHTLLSVKRYVFSKNRYKSQVNGSLTKQKNDKKSAHQWQVEVVAEWFYNLGGRGEHRSLSRVGHSAVLPNRNYYFGSVVGFQGKKWSYFLLCHMIPPKARFQANNLFSGRSEIGCKNADL